MHGPRLRLPGYVLHQRLGGGPTSDVYAATDESLRQAWAVKVLKREAELDATNRRLFEREALIGLALCHPHLVRIVAAKTDRAGSRHLVMEQLTGVSLRQAIRRRLLPVPTTLCFAHQVAEALGHMHRHGFVHGDVKPENVHLVAGRRAKLLDFGFAHRPGENTALLEEGCVLGTANYIAPELCAGPPTDDFAADVYGLGVTLYELLTGELPYREGSSEETMIRHRDEPAASLGEWTGEWPGELVPLLDGMTALHPGDRPVMHEVSDRLALLTKSMMQPIA
ncbi:serine/threonine-protein kinase [Zavarzinella formosa]|uniref:serine/threonine-protein kinase n=1 Tax=Zavarzinella formosa TaxID=360055 RepID=UPI0002F84FB7|nr:serine/threonine-protein kinase [Zavarzinella formosa]